MVPQILSLWISEPRLSAEELFVFPTDSIPEKSPTIAKSFEVSRAASYPLSGSHYAAPSLFPFNPNTLDEAGWVRLGVRPRAISTLLRYRQKGGLFKRPQDLNKIYGFSPEEVQRLIPYVQLPDPVLSEPKKSAPSATFALQQAKDRLATVHPLELNQADSADLLDLPGIGPYFAHRILQYRDKLGGYISVEQVAEIYGMPDSTFQRIRQQLKCKGVPLLKLYINKLTAPQLSLHPYISHSAAREIMRYREQHGFFQDSSALARLTVLTPEQLHKLLPYISWETPEEGKSK
ncbi:MAG: ComEA family DNA-binding protein [Chitinophagaceae bacterium]